MVVKFLYFWREARKSGERQKIYLHIENSDGDRIFSRQERGQKIPIPDFGIGNGERPQSRKALQSVVEIRLRFWREARKIQKVQIPSLKKSILYIYKIKINQLVVTIVSPKIR